MSDNIELKKDFRNYFHNFLESNLELKYLFYEIFIYGSIYVVGGFVRDFLNFKKSRDLDIIIDIDNELLINIVNESNIPFSINRHQGIKLQLENIEVDLWSISNNWAFKNNLVKLNEKDKLLSIAKGCFYNYDSLVINLMNFNYNLQYYSDFINNKVLDILQKKPIYKTLNPTIEANILRALYLRNKLGVTFTQNTVYYLIQAIKDIESWHTNDFDRLMLIKNNYKKYNDFSATQLYYELERFKSEINNTTIQLLLF